MTTPDFIIALFYAVDQEMLDVPKHPEAKLYPSEVVTLALLLAVKGGGMRAFYRWLTRDYLPLFPQVPERTRLARLFKTHTAWTARFLAAPTVFDRVLSGRPHDPGGGGYLRDRTDSSHAGRTQPCPNRQEGHEQSSVDCRREALFHPEPVGGDLCLGLRHRQRPRYAFSTPHRPI